MSINDSPIPRLERQARKLSRFYLESFRKAIADYRHTSLLVFSTWVNDARAYAPGDTKCNNEKDLVIFVGLARVAIAISKRV